MNATRRIGEGMFKFFGTLFLLLGLILVWNKFHQPQPKSVPWNSGTECFIIEKEKGN